MYKIIWLTGQSGAGKTTLAKKLQKEWPCIILDGDEMRNSISLGTGFSREDRTEHNYKVARLAKVISNQLNVIVSVIAPIASVRASIDTICEPIWIYLKRELPPKKGHFYEEPVDYFTVDCNITSVRNSVLMIMNHLNLLTKQKYSLFIGRWQPLHQGHITLFEKVREEGREVLIAIRDTELNDDNPYTIFERQQMIKEKVPYARVIVIPDITEIVYGRKVGWGIREIRVDKEIENISATKIREENLYEK